MAGKTGAARVAMLTKAPVIPVAQWGANEAMPPYAKENKLRLLPRKTLSHRRKIGTLTPEQSDRLLRVVRVIAAAEETFGSQEKAARWLRRPTDALEGDAPIALLDTTEGSREVEHLLARIDHGLAV